MIKSVLKKIDHIFHPQKKQIEWDSWNLDHSLSLWILPRLRKLHEIVNGYNESVLHDKTLIENAKADGVKWSNDKDDRGVTLWKYAIERMIYSFMCVDDLVFLDQQDTIRYNFGLDLFRKYFNNLWN